MLQCAHKRAQKLIQRNLISLQICIEGSSENENIYNCTKAYSLMVELPTEFRILHLQIKFISFFFFYFLIWSIKVRPKEILGYFADWQYKIPT